MRISFATYRRMLKTQQLRLDSKIALLIRRARCKGGIDWRRKRRQSTFPFQAANFVQRSRRDQKIAQGLCRELGKRVRNDPISAARFGFVQSIVGSRDSGIETIVRFHESNPKTRSNLHSVPANPQLP